MYKILLMPVLLVFACIIAGLYGMIHNQISYTVSPEYFHQYKFVQFDISPHFHNRLGASIVGWYASWWMGIVIGIFLIPIGLIVPNYKSYTLAIFRSFAVVAATTFLVGITALLYAYIFFNSDTANQIVINGDSLAFLRAGTMHNFSYLGGVIGIVSGTIWLLFERDWASIPSRK